MNSHLPMLVQSGNLSLDPVFGSMSVKRLCLFPLIATPLFFVRDGSPLLQGNSIRYRGPVGVG
jgi:hypothetical protein